MYLYIPPSNSIFTQNDEFLKNSPAQNIFSEQKSESQGQILLAKSNRLEADIWKMQGHLCSECKNMYSSKKLSLFSWNQIT